MLKIVGIDLLEVSFTAAKEYWKMRGEGNAPVHVFTNARLCVCSSRSCKRKRGLCQEVSGESSQKEVCRNASKLQGVKL